MKEFNLKEYNRLCAELLGFVNTTPTDKDFNIHEHPTGVLGKTMIETNFTNLFTEDWNWIIEVVEMIECVKNTSGIHTFMECPFHVKKEGDAWEVIVDNDFDRKKGVKSAFPFTEHYKGSSKENAVQAIWQFLCWYNEIKN